MAAIPPPTHICPFAVVRRSDVQAYKPPVNDMEGKSFPKEGPSIPVESLRLSD